MKVLLISSSPRAKSRTLELATNTLETLNRLGVQTEIYSVRGKDIKHCRACNRCKVTGNCVINDDMQELYSKLKEADGIIIASPVYFYDINSQLKTIIDRTYAVQPMNGNKVGATIVTAGSIGHSGAIKTIETFFTVHGIANTGFISAYAVKEELVKAKESATRLGNKMFEAIKLLKDSKTEPFAMLNHYSYGTHTF
ncbi:MAG: flavodoxin family protein [Bacteroidales bacterium]|jgi:multimeric flavodoxin WrbA|nr:flavodoxin family protein [Bacteroidales bacterium]